MPDSSGDFENGDVERIQLRLDGGGLVEVVVGEIVEGDAQGLRQKQGLVEIRTSHAAGHLGDSALCYPGLTHKA